MPTRKTKTLCNGLLLIFFLCSIFAAKFIPALRDSMYASPIAFLCEISSVWAVFFAVYDKLMTRNDLVAVAEGRGGVCRFLLGFVLVSPGLYLLAVGIGDWWARTEGISNLAVSHIQTSPAARQLLGDNSRAAWPILTDSASIGGEQGHGIFNIPVIGNQHAGTLYVEATEESGLWQIKILKLSTRNSDPIALMQ